METNENGNKNTKLIEFSKSNSKREVYVDKFLPLEKINISNNQTLHQEVRKKNAQS